MKKRKAERPLWVLIDGNNWFARDFFASGPDGNADQTFLRRLQDVTADLQPELVAICWDSRSFRHELSECYKAGRGEKPAGFEQQLAALRLHVAASVPEAGSEAGSPSGTDGATCPLLSLACEGFEADDLLAATAAAAVAEGVRAIIFSTDRDLHQCLVADQVNQCTYVRRVGRDQLRYECVTAAGIADKYGVEPHQWVDYRAIVGDKSDGLAGCPGLGPQAATLVLQRCGSIDAYYRDPFRVALSARQRTKLLNYRDQVPAVRRLLKLRTDAPLPASFWAHVAGSHVAASVPEADPGCGTQPSTCSPSEDRRSYVGSVEAHR